MKIRVFLFMALYAIVSKAQIANISEMASGSMELFSPILESDNSVYGYFSLYKLERINKEEERFEYVFLDKNLNKVANGEFIEQDYKGFDSKFYYPEKVGKNIIISRLYIDKNYYNRDLVFVTNRLLNLSTNEISESFYYEDNEFIEGSRQHKKLKSIIKKIKTFEYPLAFEEGFFLVEKVKSDHKALKNVNSLRAFDITKKSKWEYEYNPNSEKLHYSISLLDKECIVITTVNAKTYSRTLHFVNPESGELMFTYELENKKSEYSHQYDIEILDNEIVIVGKFCPYNKYEGYQAEDARGMYKIVLSKKGEELFKKYTNWTDLPSDVIQINKKGKMLEDGYKLYARQFFVFEDGSISILTEKYKDSKYYVLFNSTPKSTDFVILNFDKDFNLVSKEVIEKDKNNWGNSDYLYSQKIKNGKGVVFFYRDYKTDKESKEKNWVLGIVSIIDSKMTHEQIPMSSEDHFIAPYMAKEGYILLREFNKDKDYDQIRLERLNY